MNFEGSVEGSLVDGDNLDEFLTLIVDVGDDYRSGSGLGGLVTVNDNAHHNGIFRSFAECQPRCCDAASEVGVCIVCKGEGFAFCTYLKGVGINVEDVDGGRLGNGERLDDRLAEYGNNCYGYGSGTNLSGCILCYFFKGKVAF